LVKVPVYRLKIRDRENVPAFLHIYTYIDGIGLSAADSYSNFMEQGSVHKLALGNGEFFLHYIFRVLFPGPEGDFAENEIGSCYTVTGQDDMPDDKLFGRYSRTVGAFGASALGMKAGAGGDGNNQASQVCNYFRHFEGSSRITKIAIVSLIQE
jgi:hypothetical protein